MVYHLLSCQQIETKLQFILEWKKEKWNKVTCQCLLVFCYCDELLEIIIF